MTRGQTTLYPEFRHETAALVLDHGYSTEQACEAMGVGPTAVRRWVRQLRQERGGQTPECGAAARRQLLARLASRISLQRMRLRRPDAGFRPCMTSQGRVAEPSLGEPCRPPRSSTSMSVSVLPAFGVATMCHPWPIVALGNVLLPRPLHPTGRGLTRAVRVAIKGLERRNDHPGCSPANQRARFVRRRSCNHRILC